MEFTAVLKGYLEIGVLGICAVCLVVLFALLIKKLLSSNEAKDKSVQQQNEKLLTIITEQNQRLIEEMNKQSQQMIESAVKQITTHVPSLEDNNKQTKISEQVDKCLQEILLQTNASRASLVQYHNGGTGVNKQRFLKMSMTNEQVQLGVKPLITEFRDQFRSVLGYFVKQINDEGVCFIPDVELVKDIDSSLYEFMSGRNIQSKFGVAIKGPDDYVFGFICIEFLDKSKVDVDRIKFVLTDYQHTIQTLLNM